MRCINGVLLLPLEVCCIAFVSQFAELGSTLLVEFLDLGEDSEWCRRITAQVGDGLLIRCAGFAERVTVRRALALERLTFGGDAAFTHNRMTDNERRTLFLGFGSLQRLADGIRIVAVDLLHEPVPSFVLHGYILAGYLAAHRGELYFVAVIEHDQVIQAKVTGYTACSLRDLFLHTAIGDEGIDRRIMHLAETCIHELSRDGSTYGKRVALTKRTAGVLNHALDVTFGVTGRYTTPLTEVLKVFE